MAWNLGLRRKMNMPSGLWVKCDGCSEMVYKKDVEDRLNTCPKCGHHFRISARERVRITLDGGSFEELYADLEPVDRLGFNAARPYAEKLKQAQEATGLRDAALCGIGSIDGEEVVFLVTDPSFIQGSMGVVVGEKIALCAEKAAALHMPFIVVSGSGGGARMEEGVLSLMQMAKTSAAIARLSEARVLYAVVLTNATMGGALASWASLGDVTIAEPRALIGFTGPRVLRQTVKTVLPKGFQTSEFLLEKGFIDAIVPRSDIKPFLARMIRYCTRKAPGRIREALGRVGKSR